MLVCRLIIVAFPQPTGPAAAINFCPEYGSSRRMRPGVESWGFERQRRAIVRGTNRLHRNVARCGGDFHEANRAKQFRPD